MRSTCRFASTATAACGFAILITSLIAAPLRAADGPATAPTTRPIDYFRMSPDQFAQSEPARRELPWENVDDRLLSAAILHETNRFRVEHKMPPLRHMPKLDDAAAMHASDMSAGGWFAHENPHDPKKRLVFDRVKLLGLNPMFVGENIIMEYGIQYEPRRKVYDTRRGGRAGLSYRPNGEPIPRHTYHSFAKQVVQRWIDSPPHHENVVSKHARFLGSAARPGHKEDEERFQKFYAAQVFFAPMPAARG